MCAASRQKSLQGLDYFLTEEAQAFESIVCVIMVLEEGGATSIWGKKAKAIIKEAKCYLKTDHVGPEERCVDHCTGFSLSDPHNHAFAQHCDHTHDMSCLSCSQLDEVLSNVMSMINSPNLTLTDEHKCQVTFDVTCTVEAITNWKAHIFRTVNQEQAKEEILGALNNLSVLVIMDWAMKYLPSGARKKLAYCLCCFQNLGERIQC